jgi:LacI family transcriptional regulator
MKIKMDDLARKLDLSVGAVSMALNNKKGVSEETRQRVVQAAQEMGYKLKSASKPTEDVSQKKYLQLIRLKKHGLVAADTAFFSEVGDGIDEAAKKAGYQLLISNLYINDIKRNSFESEDYDHADGVIVFATELDSEDVSFLHDLKKKIVILDSYFVDQGWDTILMNNYEAAFQAIQYFYKKK